MRMGGLARLHAGMQAIGLKRVKFRVRHNHLVFSSLFLTDVAPYELALACLGHDFVLVFNVTHDYEVSAYLGDKYGALAAALGTGAGSENRLQPGVFLREIDAALPRFVGPGDRPTHGDVVQVYRDVEEADKVYLCDWRDNTVRKQRVSQANLAKTRRLIGQDAHDLCKRRNLSTCWTDDPRRAIAAELPEL